MGLKRVRRSLTSSPSASSWVYPNLARDFIAASSEQLQRSDDANFSMGAGVSMTVCAWVYPDLVADRVIVSKWNFPPEEWLLYLSDATPDVFRFAVVGTGGVGGAVNASTFGEVTAGSWYFVAARHTSGVGIEISVNGGSWDATAHATNIRDQTAAFAIGFGTGIYWDGAIDCVGVWKRALEDAEVVSLYNGGVGLAYHDLTAGLKVSLVEWYDLDEAAGADAVGAHAGLTLTATNTPGSRAGKR